MIFFVKIEKKSAFSLDSINDGYPDEIA